MTMQQIFDKVWRGLKRQGFKQSTKRNMCLYRGPHGRKCAAGHLIKDKHYDPSIEGEGVGCSVTSGKLSNATQRLLKSGVRKHQLKFVQRLQGIHDFNAKPDRMKEVLENLAAERKLTVPKR